MDRDVACQHWHWWQLFVCLLRLSALSRISDEFLQRYLNKAEESTSLRCCRVCCTPKSVLPGQQTLMRLLAAILDLIHRIHSVSLIWEKRKALISLCSEVRVIAWFEGAVQQHESSPAPTHHALAKTASCTPCRCLSRHILEG